MSKQSEYIYECPWTGKSFEPDDKKLIGLGNPPRSPHEPPGMGGIPMRPIPRPAKTVADQPNTNPTK